MPRRPTCVQNVALFGQTARQWRDAHPDDKGNIRDYANVSQLVCLSNLENLNAHFIKEGLPPQDSGSAAEYASPSNK